MKKIIILVLIGISVFLMACEKDVIRVGVITTLTGNNSDIGVAIRDGILLKINEINEEGGIDGHKIELIIKDDQGDLQLVNQYTKDFIDQGVKLLFGYETSSKISAIEAYLDDEDLFFISPTISSYELSDRDDSFFRVIPTNYQQGLTLGQYAKKYSKKTLILYSQINETFAKGVYEGYSDAFEGQVLIKAVDQDILEIENEILSWYEGMDSIMVVMNPNDTLLTSQILFRSNIETKIYSSNWGMAANAYQNGGQSIEGSVFVSLLGDETYLPYQDFINTYKDAYNEEPAFAAIYAYEAGILLTEALKESDDFNPRTVKRELLNLGRVEGVISDLELNEYGDIKRDNLVVKLIEGEFILQE